MKFHTDLIQGTKAWKQLRASHFTASEAAAMLGLSKYQTRSQLLHQKATGETEEVTPAKQKLFDQGHSVEELARPIAEAYIGDELFPATITNEIDGLPLLASMDGITMLGDKGFEHKLKNADLMAKVNAGEVPETHWPQLEQQLLVSGTEAILFVVSDGTEETRAQCWYESKPDRRAQLISGWKQFKEDLANYTPAGIVEKVEAAPVRELPAIRYTMNGLSLDSNLDAYKQAATDLVELSKAPLESDQDFANAEARQKVFTKAEKDIKEACERVMGEIESIDTFVKDMRFIAENIRQARLAEAKQIKARKEEIRKEIFQDAINDLNDYRFDIESKVSAQFPPLAIDVSDAMKGKKTIDSLRDAAQTEVARGKIIMAELGAIAAENKKLVLENSEYKFLFNDWSQIAFKDTETFGLLLTARIAEHQAQERAKAEAQRERIRQEEQAKAQAEAQAKLQAESNKEAEITNEVPSKTEVPTAQYMEHPVKQTRTRASQFNAVEINAVIQFVAHLKESAPHLHSEVKTLSEQYLQLQNSEAA